MNVYEAINTVLSVARIESNTQQVVEAGNVVNQLLNAYNALAPTPEQWAEYPAATWYAIDSETWRNGYSTACFYEFEPQYISGEWRSEPESFQSEPESFQSAPDVLIPVGIDWRLCKWSREAAQ